MKTELHKTQQNLLSLIKNNHDHPLTIKELQVELDLSSTSVVFHHIQKLEKKGYIKRNPNNPRDYQILGEPEKPIAYLNLYGLAQCGKEGSILSGSPQDRVPIASRLIKFPTEHAFLVTAKGKSMEPHINDSDLVITRKSQDANNGEVVVCVNNEVAIIKKFYKQDNTIILHSFNSDNPPFVAAEDFRIEGVVKGVISYNPKFE